MRYLTFARGLVGCCAVLLLFVFLPGGDAMGMELTSVAFKDGGDIPLRYTGLGENISPELAWSGVPDGTKSFVLIVEDPDAPSGTWVHWLVYNIPKDFRGFSEGASGSSNLGKGTTEGRNSFRERGYGGPEPPPGSPHRYIFTVYALGNVVNIPSGANKNKVESAMKGRILDSAQLSGRFGR